MKKLRHDPDSDQDLLVRYRDGDTAAFRLLVDFFQDRMVQFFYRLCWDRDRAEDLTQDLFLKLMQGCRRYRPQGKLSTFVYRVATNLWIDHYRSMRPQPRLYSLDQVVSTDSGDGGGSSVRRREIAGQEPTPMESAANDEEKQVMRKALESLTEPHRIVFELAVYQERPYSEISELLGIPVGTIKSRMHNSVAALKKIMGEAEARAERSESDGAAGGQRRPAGGGA